ncbi:MAG: glycoside hydrolase family 88 protein [Paraglaciecola sp.]|uniref:glycoside hydrolase family 88/105 protein n=1 Tax=Paraglaciecola sp. TaxID=1920173 RepID=UPI0032969996
MLKSFLFSVKFFSLQRCIRFAVLLCVFASSSLLAKGSDELWSVRMADSEMLRNPQAYTLDWRDTPRWSYTHGLELMAFWRLYQATDDERYFNYIQEYVDTLVKDDGSIKTYDISKYNIDMINPGKLLFFMWDKTQNDKYRKALDLLRSQLKDHPRTSEGGFWHKKRYTSQMWLDGLYMGTPFYAEYAVRFGTQADLDDVVEQFQLVEKYLYRDDTGLPIHGWDETKKQYWANKQNGQSPHHWGRSIGWYAMAMVDVLDWLPKTHAQHGWLKGRLQNLLDNMLKLQHRSGVWYQVPDKGDVGGNYLESSGSAMMTYVLARAVNKGHLPARYQAQAEKAYQGLLDNFIYHDKVNNQIHITRVCAVAGLGGKPYRDASFEYYMSETIRSNDPKAVGPFILASLELQR